MYAMQILIEETGEDISSQFEVIATYVLQPKEPEQDCPVCDGKGYTDHPSFQLRCPCAWE